MGTTKTIPEMRDIICNEMKEIYGRSEGEDEIREILQLERSMEIECDSREADARFLIRGKAWQVNKTYYIGSLLHQYHSVRICKGCFYSNILLKTVLTFPDINNCGTYLDPPGQLSFSPTKQSTSSTGSTSHVGYSSMPYTRGTR